MGRITPSTRRAHASSKNDLLELYCGNGNFTIPMSRNFRKVLATEVSKANTECARENLTANQVKNVQFARLNAKETADALQPGARPFKRLTEAGVDLSSLKLETLFVDPPRAGLEPAAIGLARSFDTVVYVSCNPETLADDIEQLSHTHDVTHAAVFDQFPYTRHCEAGVLLKKRSGVDLSTVPEPRAPRRRKIGKRYAGKRKGKGKGGGKAKKLGARRRARQRGRGLGVRRELSFVVGSFCPARRWRLVGAGLPWWARFASAVCALP